MLTGLRFVEKDGQRILQQQICKMDLQEDRDGFAYYTFNPNKPAFWEDVPLMRINHCEEVVPIDAGFCGHGAG